MPKIFIKKNTRKIYGTLTFYIDEDDNIATITYIDIYEAYRGKGLGTFLLWNLYEYIKNNHPLVQYIELDDCSDHYKKYNNIYRNVGARYLYIKGPEMIWKIYSRTVINKYKSYKSYKSNTNNKIPYSISLIT